MAIKREDIPVSVTLENEDGSTTTYDTLGVFPAGPHLYLALCPEEDTQVEEIGVMLVRIEQEGDGFVLTEPQTDEEYALASAEFAKVAAKWWPEMEELKVEGERPVDLTARRPH